VTPPMKNKKSAPLAPPAKPLLIVLSGLSGVGKDTVLAELRKSGFSAYISISAATRKPRPGEKDGVDYYFISKAKFQAMIAKDELMEHAAVYGNYYGIPKEPVRQALKTGNDVIVKIDVQGAATIKSKYPQAVSIFLLTSTLDELEKRLKKRRTETAAELELRLKTALDELSRLNTFDFVVVNRDGEITHTVEEIRAIIEAEKCRATQREIKI
jgi:guanylate kinase